MPSESSHIPLWDAEEGVSRATRLLRERLDCEADLVAVGPGRVNLIGEHVDYNSGIAIPFALPHATYAAAAARADERVRIVSAELDGAWEGTLDELDHATGWAAYVTGVLWALREQGAGVPGMDLAVTSCVPLGSGLSSSASLETAVAVAALGLVNERLTPQELIGCCMRAESEIAHAPTGGLDQSAAVLGEEGSAVLLDFGQGTFDLVPASPEGYCWMIVDTRVTHSHTTSGYGDRRAETRAAVERLSVGSLRELMDRHQEFDRLPEPLRSRARHVVTDSERAARFAGALKVSAIDELGPLMNASHASMRDDFEISCPELDVAVEAAVSAGADGARMTGGGFGGSAVALVRRQYAEAVSEAVQRAFAGRQWRVPGIAAITPAAGARVVSQR